MKRNLRWINLIGLVIMLLVNFLADRLPLGGKTTGEISAQYPVLITPAGYAFSIWTVIYLLLIGFVIYGFTRRGRENGVIPYIGFYFFVSCLLNSAWLFAWHYEKLTSSVFIMFALLLSLITIYARVHTHRTSAMTAADKWLIRLPFSIYLGWICVASIVNVATALYAAKWDGFGLPDTGWAIIMLTVAALIAVVIALRHKDLAVLLVFIWAFTAIAYKQQATPVVANIGLALALLLAVYALILVFQQRGRGRQ